MEDIQKKRFLLNVLCFSAAGAGVYLFLRYLFRWLLPFLLAFAAAAAIEPAIRFMGRRLQIKRGFSAAVLTLFLLFVLGGLLSLLLSALFAEATSFLMQAPALLDTLSAQTERLLTRLRTYGALCPDWLKAFVSDGFSRYIAPGGTALTDLSAHLLSVLRSLAAGLPHFLLSAATTVLAVYFISSSYPRLRAAFSAHLSEENRRRAALWRIGATRSLVRWLRAQAILCFLTFCQLLAGFLLLRSPYALLAAFLITLVDALPVFGTGTVLIPWALGEFLLGSVPRGILLAALYLCTLLVRNIAEPKLMAAQAGLPPIASLFAMYLGFCTFGVLGMLFFPFTLLLVMQIQAAKKESQS